MNPTGILLVAEKRVAAALFRRVLSPEVARGMLLGMYPDEVAHPLFIDSDEEDQGGSGDSSSETTVWKLPNVDDAKWLRFEVTGLFEEHYTRLQYPAFRIRLVRRNGEEIERPTTSCGQVQTVLDTRVRLSVFNKWADVTHEVLTMHSSPIRVLVDGTLVVSDWTFQDISHKHGGYFQITIRPLDFTSEILEWKSPRLLIHSDKILNKQRAKQVEQSDTD
eukprot:c1668_g1_i1.p1 GENE.c1668_g1_i1~~c1668_g1_i1.p1  ORF type:complete len:220 (-),score=49.70 c1668_g1_i1:121-780(-)